MIAAWWALLHRNLYERLIRGNYPTTVFYNPEEAMLQLKYQYIWAPLVTLSTRSGHRLPYLPLHAFTWTSGPMLLFCMHVYIPSDFEVSYWNLHEDQASDMNVSLVPSPLNSFERP